MLVKRIAVLLVLVVAGCGSPESPASVRAALSVAPSATSGTSEPAAVPRRSPAATPSSSPQPKLLPRPGNAGGDADVPADARAEDTGEPDRVVGKGTPASCTSAAVVKAVAAGGKITFNCGPAPLVIRMTAAAKVRNGNGPVVIDGGHRVTLDGGGKRRLIYLNTCDRAQGWTTSHCQDQDHPRLTVQNLALRNGNSTGDTTEGGGVRDNEAIGRGANPARGGTPGGGSGGAIYLDGNRFTLTLDGTMIERNHAREGGGAVFFVSNDRTGTLAIRDSTLRRNPSDGFETAGLPGIFWLGAGNPSVRGSTLRK